jgi:hypothetical protein
MEVTRNRGDDLLDIVRVLLLVQGGVLLATTVEALVWAIAFGGAAGPSFLVTAAMAGAIFVARARMRVDRRWAQRLVYVVEGVLVATLAIDTALAVAIIGAVPPAVAVLTRFVLPVSVIALLRRATRSAAALSAPATAAAAEGVS